jgi:4-hydroxy-4-methyl-2-oxoglutarate aldolase
VGGKEMSGEKSAVAGELGRLGAATLGESGGVSLSPRLRPAWPGAKVAGPACPVRCSPADNLAVHVAVASAAPGSVLVVDVGGVAARGYFGEVLATGALARGIAGLVIDGGVRDTEALEALGFPVFSTTVALPGATKSAPGSVGLPVRVGDVMVHPGDWVVADGDGVVAVRAAEVTAVLEAGRAREEKERRYFEALRAGGTTVELLGLDTSPIEVAPDPSGELRGAPVTP